MVSTEVLNVVLATLAALWLILSLVIVIGRACRDRRARRTAAVRSSLLRVGPAVNSEDTGRLAAPHLTPHEFQQLAREGLPRQAEVALACELRARNGARGLRRLAEGAARADVWDRIAALQILVSSEGAALPAALGKALRSGSPNLAAAAVRMLVRLDDDRASELLIDALHDGVYPRSRLAAAVDRLSALRPEALAPLLHAQDPEVRFWGVRLAGRLHAHEWAALARTMAGDRAPLVRRAAVEALGVIGEYGDRLLLMEAFRDPVAMVRLHAARASAAFADADVAQALTGLLADRDWVVRAAAREALSRIGPIGRKPVLRTLWHTDRFAANNAAEVLYLNGVAAAAARRVLAESGGAVDLVAFITRFFDVAGPQLREAVLSHFDGADRAALLAHAREVPPSPRSTRRLG